VYCLMVDGLFTQELDAQVDSTHTDAATSSTLTSILLARPRMSVTNVSRAIG